MSDFDSDERSVQDSRPRELYTLVIGNQTYRLASGVRSISYGGNIYKAFQISRNEAGVSEETNSPKQLQITLPMSHPACQRYMAFGTPPKSCSVNIVRLQLNSGAAMAQWTGDIISIGFNRHMATFLVASTASRVMMRVLGVTVGDQCSHALYDSMCTVDRNAFKLTTTVLQVDGRKIKVDGGSGHLSPWWVYGDAYHPGTGERMDIVSQQDLGPPSTVVWLTMQAPIVGLNTGDSVEVSPGCDHTITTGCFTKFNNKDNFGGMPSLPNFNPFVFNVLGSILKGSGG